MAFKLPRRLRRLKRLHSQAALAPDRLEELAESLKERIYATLALLAIMLSLNPATTSVSTAALEVGGTAVSLWLASLVSAQMAYRAVHGRLMPRAQAIRLVRVHGALLISAVPPLILIGCAGLGLFSLRAALATATGLSIATLFIWSLASARAMRASFATTLVLAAFEGAIGLAVVALKLASEH